LFGSALGDNFAMIDDGNALGDAIGLIHVMSSEEDSDPFGLVQVFLEGPRELGLDFESRGGVCGSRTVTVAVYCPAVNCCVPNWRRNRNRSVNEARSETWHR
jgi:hypothetical protein